MLNFTNFIYVFDFKCHVQCITKTLWTLIFLLSFSHKKQKHRDGDGRGWAVDLEIDVRCCSPFPRLVIRFLPSSDKKNTVSKTDDLIFPLKCCAICYRSQ